jgi:hypothetical protein
MTFLLDCATVKTWKQVLMARPWRSLGDLSLQNATVLKRVGSDLVPSGSMQMQLPPPAAYRRGRCMRGSKNNGPADQVWDIDVSLSKPHRIQSISANLASFLQYTPDQLSGRSISILEGPETNSMALRAAIKSSQHSVFSVLPVMLYSRNGTAVKMEVECRPNAFVDCWCRLRIRPAGAQSRGAMDADARSAVAYSTESEARLRYRRQSRFRTGLEIQHVLRLLDVRASTSADAASNHRAWCMVVNE